MNNILESKGEAYIKDIDGSDFVSELFLKPDTREEFIYRNGNFERVYYNYLKNEYSMNQTDSIQCNFVTGLKTNLYHFIYKGIAKRVYLINTGTVIRATRLYDGVFKPIRTGDNEEQILKWLEDHVEEWWNNYG